MIVVSGGGTGGHLAIARSLTEELNSRGIKPIFIGSTQGQDKEWFENSEIFSKKFFLQSSGVVNKRGLAKVKSLLKIISLSLKCCKIFKQNNVTKVISVGGYSAAPAAFAALLSRTPLFIHEQNAITGKLNQILKPFAKGFFSSYDEFLPYDYPVSEKFFKSARERNELKTILFLGGSQGAKAINELAINLALNLKQKGIKIIHQCGKNAFNELKQRYALLGLDDNDVELFDFSKEIEQKMSVADLCISRAGASSLWELCANALPTIFVPFPYAAGNHQYHNAKFLLNKNIAKICLQSGDNIEKDEIFSLISNFDIASSSNILKTIISQNGTSDIVDKILS
ncbi:undecaprenyldiphospho-muramoylpentapeptide beta-N-acetylglucosaminyltransferase [Campylobacter sp. faydin G-105]|uniref:undecaprenyldiphospho-muramoylpentapeptide beta-N-acetylglucosaminyltransferase n=1 Tax=Campylobacter anatolicus TaxID=2829105 RepID=UPI001B9FFCC2|nr:undecaprenyldiphospho-muramoylpentapeptide beta-N-acetylglucosaminyltransferase [Campylobacter anatolicus]MBR8462860.1 undecaprenyldiphospho-muramoylpentapeptide beta-N-acetylglucosaminyltransferase [Campylobacter anatolicus]